jgi:hypothetical protein
MGLMTEADSGHVELDIQVKIQNAICCMDLESRRERYTKDINLGSSTHRLY